MVVADGDHFLIECAIRRDLSSPVADFLDEMAAGAWAPGVENGLEPDEQVSWTDAFFAACEHLADTGSPIYAASFNQLRDGIWELKHWDLRVSFYDTDGHGNHTPVVDRDSYPRYANRPWPDGFDENLRLTSAFQKRGQKAEERHMAFANQVREEDLEHDRRP